ncbi:MAG: hypothetical protein OEL53_02370 [Rhodospirillales bacterium]|nr:hypothetical protein [Rhodospirillales bacterium]
MIKSRIGPFDTKGSIEFRRAYLRSLLDAVEVGDGKVRLLGQKTKLEQLITGNSVARSGVRGFVRKWRAKGDEGGNFELEVAL